MKFKALAMMLGITLAAETIEEMYKKKLDEVEMEDKFGEALGDVEMEDRFREALG